MKFLITFKTDSNIIEAKDINLLKVAEIFENVFVAESSDSNTTVKSLYTALVKNIDKDDELIVLEITGKCFSDSLESEELKTFRNTKILTITH